MRQVTTRLLARAVVLGLVAFLFATPLMACVMETASLTVTEAECCKAMAGDCHSQVGPASHKCCRAVASVPDASKPVRAQAISHIQVATLAPAAAQLVLATSPFAPVATDASPPGSPPVCSSILRI